MAKSLQIPHYDIIVTLAITVVVVFSIHIAYTLYAKNGSADAFLDQTYYSAYPTRGDILELLAGQTIDIEGSQDIKFNKMINL